MSYIWTSGDRRVPALTPFTDETAGFLPMSFKHFAPLWPRIILTVVLTIGLVLGFPIWKVFHDVGANNWRQQEMSDSEGEEKVHSRGRKAKKKKGAG